MCQLAKAQWRAEETAGFLQTLNSWSGEHPEDAVAQAMLANGYLQLGRVDEAKAAFEKTLALAPDDVASLNNLAWLLREEDGELALEYAERAHALRPDDAVVQDTLGMILLRQGQAEKALGMLKAAAAAAAPTNPSIQYHVALALEQTGNAGSARSTLQAILAGGQDFPERAEAEAEARLAQIEGAELLIVDLIKSSSPRRARRNTKENRVGETSFADTCFTRRVKTEAFASHSETRRHGGKMREEQSIQVGAMPGFSGPVRCSARGRTRLKHRQPVFGCGVIYCFSGFFFAPPCLRVKNESDDR